MVLRYMKFIPLFGKFQNADIKRLGIFPLMLSPADNARWFLIMDILSHDNLNNILFFWCWSSSWHNEETGACDEQAAESKDNYTYEWCQSIRFVVVHFPGMSHYLSSDAKIIQDPI